MGCLLKYKVYALIIQQVLNISTLCFIYPFPTAPLDTSTLPTTRSGRRVYPQLAWWTNQRIFLHKSQEAELIQGTLDLLSPAPHMVKDDEVWKELKLKIT